MLKQVRLNCARIARFARGKIADRRGFTLTELLVVIFIISLLTVVVAVNVFPVMDRGQATKVRADLSALEQGLEMYRLTFSTFPSTEQGLDALVTAPTGLIFPEQYPEGGFIKRLPADPWGNPYVYVSPGEGTPYDLYSLGADGEPGGEGKAADIGL
jgi:general secretion pathway protein G